MFDELIYEYLDLRRAHRLVAAVSPLGGDRLVAGGPVEPRGDEPFPLAPGAGGVAELYRTPWVAEHFQCLHTEDGRYNINYVFPPLYTEEFLQRFVTNANALQARLDQPLVMENIPGFFDVKASQLPEPVWLRRFFEGTGAGFLLDLPHIWLEAHYRAVKPAAWLAEFPLERVVELHVAGVVEDNDLQGPWIAPAAPSDEMLDFMALAVSRCPRAQAVTFDAFSPSLTPEVLLSSVERIRQSL